MTVSAVFISNQTVFIKLRLRSGLNAAILPLESDAGWSSLVARRAHNPIQILLPQPHLKADSNSRLFSS
jgi:hypothetical protein